MKLQNMTSALPVPSALMFTIVLLDVASYLPKLLSYAYTDLAVKKIAQSKCSDLE